jgi:predicted small lipoprotein YifL
MKRLLSRMLQLMGLMGILAGCDVTLPLKELPPHLTLEAYTQHQELVSQRVIASDDPVYRRLKSFLDSEQTGWQWFVIPNAQPIHYVLRAKGLLILCHTDQMVIDVGEPSRSKPFGKYVGKYVPNLLQTLGLPVPPNDPKLVTPDGKWAK